MPNNKVDTFQFFVEPFEDDYTGRLSWGTLGKHILACAEKHAAARHFDRINHDGHRCLWVLSRIAFEMKFWPKLGETYNISTWVRNYYRYFTDRCFDIRDAQGNVIGYVFTIWAMIDEVTRKPIMLQTLFNQTFDPFIESERICDVSPFSRIRIDCKETHFTRQAYYSDIDENDHVNSIRYIEYILDTFPKEIFKDHQVTHLEMAYSSESYAGDELSFYKEEIFSGTFHVVVKNKQQSDATVCGCALKFQPISTE